MSQLGQGYFIGVGVGPGDPELLTVKAVKAIESADVIIAPRTEKKEDSVALTIAQCYIKPETEVLPVIFPMNFNADEQDAYWEAGRGIIAEKVQQGKKVVFLTLGDPMLYSTYIYVYRLLQDIGIDGTTIPGINSFSAIASRLGRPLAEGNDVLTIIPATLSAERLSQVLDASDSAVLMKVYRKFPQVLEALEKKELLDQAMMISRCGLDGENICLDLREQKPEDLNYLSTVLTRRRGYKNTRPELE